VDWVFLHLAVNHFPVTLGVVGALAALAAAATRRERVWRFATTTMILAALAAPAAYGTGLLAEGIVEEAPYADEAAIEEHEEIALVALLALLAAGGAAVFARVRPRGRARLLFLATSLAAAAVTGYTAFQGGEIVHESPALRTGR